MKYLIWFLLIASAFSQVVNPPAGGGGGGSGTVTDVSVTTANGVSGTVANSTTTPAITLTLGAITPTTINKLTITPPATGSTLNIADGKTFTVNNTLTISGTDGSTLNIGAGGTLGTAAFTDISNTTSFPFQSLTTTGTSGAATLVAGVLNIPQYAGSGTVTTTGTPANGNLTKFSGATSITNGDLSGDVTTSGTLATTVGKINGTSMAGLATGILKNTTTTGVPSIAVANTDYLPVASPTATGTLTAATVSLSGNISSSAAATFVVQATSSQLLQLLAGSGNTAQLSGRLVNTAGNDVLLSDFTPRANTSGNATTVVVQGTFNPASGSGTFYGLNINPTINQTSTSSGSYEALHITAVETSLKGSSNYLIHAFAGASGTTDTFGVTNAGAIIAAGGMALGGATGGNEGNGTINLTSAPYINGVQSLTRTIASGAQALNTAAIASATCDTVVTATATGTATTDTVTASFNGDPTAVTGYIPLTSGMLTIVTYPTANTVNFKVCNNTTGSITPGAITLNWKVVR